jgi:hypothetical protein
MREIYQHVEFSGGAQGKAPKPPCKREGSQERARREKQKQRQLPQKKK